MAPSLLRVLPRVADALDSVSPCQSLKRYRASSRPLIDPIVLLDCCLSPVRTPRLPVP